MQCSGPMFRIKQPGVKGTSLASCVIFGKVLHLSVPQLPHQQNGVHKFEKRRRGKQKRENEGTMQ